LIELFPHSLLPDLRFISVKKSNSVSSIFWFGDSRELVGRVSSEIAKWSQIDWRTTSITDLANHVSSLPPCQVVVIELQTWLERSQDRDQTLANISNELVQTVKANNFPIIICLGSNVANDHVVAWMRGGIYSFSDLSNSPSHIAKRLSEAKQFAYQLHERYQRFKKLEAMWNSISPEEMAVLDLIFVGTPNKTIAMRMGTSQRTIESRRHRLFAKLESKSLPIVIQRVCEWHQLQRQFSPSEQIE
jgi:FixJ family two-component response regulator